MTKFFRRIYDMWQDWKSLRDPTRVRLPSNVKLVDGNIDPNMSFNLVLGFDVVADSSQMGVRVSSMAFSSDNTVAKKFIESANPDDVKNVAALLALAACKQIAMAPVSNYHKATIGPTDLTEEQILAHMTGDTKLLN